MFTYLSTNIYEFFCLTKSNTQLKTNNKYVLNNLTLNLEELSNIFSDCANENFNIHTQTNDWYLDKLKIVHEIMCECENKINTIDSDSISKILDNCIWTNRIQDLKICFDYYSSKNESDWLKCVLILCSVIERSLGNVYKIESKNVPFLLKDLLETNYLFQLFNYGLIRLMQLLCGTAKALNIRNICWHGFISTNELSQTHIAVLFIICATIGHILNNKNIVDIPIRPQITNLEQKISEILEKNTFIDIYQYMDSIQENCEFISPLQVNYWKNIKYHPVGNCQNNCLLLLLPLFEHVLRLIFCKVNNCDRMILASNKEKYVTLDEIFAENYDKKRNKMREILNTGCVDFYDDVFSLLNGLRIRDKLGHGEIELYSIPCLITKVLLNFFTFIILQSEKYFNKAINDDLLNVLQQNFKNYEGIYHPKNILKYKIICTYENLQKLRDIPKPDENEIEKCDVDTNIDVLTEITEKISNKYERNIKEYVQNNKIKCTSEKAIKKLINVVNEMNDICTQIIIDNEDRYNNFINKTLGTRQIHRYDEILKSITIMEKSITCVLHIVVLIYFNEVWNTDKNLYKFLVLTLNYMEKIRRNSNVKINKWRKCRSLTREYQKNLSKFMST